MISARGRTADHCADETAHCGPGGCVIVIMIAVIAVMPAAGGNAADRVWQLTRNGVVVQDPGRTTRVPLPDWIYAGPRFGCAPVLAVGPDGEAVRIAR